LGRPALATKSTLRIMAVRVVINRVVRLPRGVTLGAVPTARHVGQRTTRAHEALACFSLMPRSPPKPRKVRLASAPDLAFLPTKPCCAPRTPPAVPVVV